MTTLLVLLVIAEVCLLVAFACEWTARRLRTDPGCSCGRCHGGR